MRKITKPTVKLQIAFLLAVSIWACFVACKSTDKEPTSPAKATPLEGKAERTRITDATAPATHVWAQPTTIIETKDTPTTGATSTPASADDQLVQRGKGLFEKNECNGCHGDNAEGLPDQGAKLAGTSLTEEEFEDILRTGGKGRLGNEHIFGISAISPSGIKAVYAYLQSLAE